MYVVNDGTQIETGSTNNSVKVNINGDAQFFTLMDWGDAEVKGDVTVNIGPKAHFNGAQSNTAVSLGGDHQDPKTAKILGKTYITVDGTQSEGNMIYRNGFKKMISTELNGLQVLLKNTNIGFGDHPNFLAGKEAGTASYENNDNEYVVKASTIEGSDVVLPEFGKASITLGEGMKAVVVDAEGEKEVTETSVIDLVEGETTITIVEGKNVKNDGLTIAGAQIRLPSGSTEQGLRFVADYTDELAAQYAGCEFGFVVLPKAALGNNALVVDGKYNYNDKEYTAATVPAVRLFDDLDGYVQYTVCLTGLEAEQYKTEYVAVTYIEVAEGEYVYGEQYAASVYKIAEAVVNDEKETDADLKAAMQALIDAAK